MSTGRLAFSGVADKMSAAVQLDREQCLELQGKLIEGYSTTAFQQHLHRLVNAAGSDPLDKLKARAEASLMVQSEVLPQYGFTPDRKGINDSFKAFLPWNSDPAVANNNGIMLWLIDVTGHDSSWLEKHGLNAPEVVEESNFERGMLQFVEVTTQRNLQPQRFAGDMLVDDEGAQPASFYKEIAMTLLFLEDESAHLVQTFGGVLLKLSEADLRDYVPPLGERGGFDAAWPSELVAGVDGVMSEEEVRFSLRVGELMARKGFCVIQMSQSAKERRSALEATSKLSQWKRMSSDVEAAYLGREATGKACWIPKDDLTAASEDLQDGLQKSDRKLTELAFTLDPLTQSHFGFTGFGRSAGVARRPFASKQEEEALLRACVPLKPPQIWGRGGIGDELQSVYAFVQLRKLCMFYFVAGSGGSLALHPKRAGSFDEVSIPCVENRIVLFNHELMSYTYAPDGDALALQAWVLSQSHQSVVSGIDSLSVEAGIAPLTTPAPAYGKSGRTVGVMSTISQTPGNVRSSDGYCTMLVSGCDATLQIPFERWDHDVYYEPQKDKAYGKIYSNHGGFLLHGIYDFDSDFFGFDDERATLLDPCIRHGIEIGYETLHRAGFSRATILNRNIGVYVGFSSSDWQAVIGGSLLLSQYGPSSIEPSPCVQHLSHTFGLRGPCVQTDTACSSSLTVTSIGHAALRPLEPGALKSQVGEPLQWALCIGCNGLLGPFTWIGLSAPHMLSATGRCFTFDESADGFNRGEGFASMSLKDNAMEEEPSDRLAMLCGSAMNQDGRSASMTAPHGPSQQECILKSMREAGISPSDVRVAELHGTGTALGDPIEIGALRNVMRKRTTNIAKTSAKSNLGHLEATAGMAGLVKCVLMVTRAATTPNVHLVALNPHADTNQYPVLFPSELAELGGNSGYAGVSSFGFGGANARGDVWGRALQGPWATGGSPYMDKLAYLEARRLDIEDRASTVRDPDFSQALHEKARSEQMAEYLQKAAHLIASDARLPRPSDTVV